MPTYRQILAKAWNIAWHNPYLWLYGFFAFLFGTALEFDLIGRAISPELYRGLFGSFWLGVRDAGLITSIAQPPALPLPQLIVALIVPVLLLVIAVALLVGGFWFTMVSQAALISECVALGRGKARGFAASFRTARAAFWPLATLYVASLAVFSALMFPVRVLLVPVSVYEALVGPALGGPLRVRLLYLGFLLLFVLVLGACVFLAMAVRYAACAVVLKAQPLRDAFSQGVRLAREHWLLSLEMVIVLFAIIGSVNTVLTSAFLFLLERIFTSSTSAIFPSLFVGLFTLITIFVAAVSTVFYWAVWAIVYELLISSRVSITSRLIKWFSRASRAL